MAQLRIIDRITDPGHSGRGNEDSLGWNAETAFVLDGATTLGESLSPPPQTDAAWISNTLAVHLARNLLGDATTQDVLRTAISEAATVFHGWTDDRPADWRNPVACLIGVRTLGADAGHVELFGLGDTVAYGRPDPGTDPGPWQSDAGGAWRWSPVPDLRDTERASAGAALARNGGFGATGTAWGEAQALQELRRKRARYNQPGGHYWLPGVVPEAADFLATRPLPAGVPLTVLLCSDGFAELADHYDRHSADSLLEAAERRGLASLLADLRHIERIEDPDGVRYPRFKQSDDATAVLVRIG